MGSDFPPSPGVVSAVATPPGWYGKLMALGDFASRRLPPEWVRVCDQWLSACLTHSRAELGPAWLALYLNAPLWRFAWAPGVIDAQWWSGVLMPSCDKVGRYFPLVVAQAGIAPSQDAAAQAQLEDWYRQVAEAALRTLDGLSVDAFDAELAQTPPLPRPSVSDQGAWQQLAGCSLWWPWLPDEPLGPVRMLTGLPQPQQFSAMLDGRW